MMVRMTKVTTLGTPASQLLCMIGIAVVLTFAVFQMQNGALDRGQFVTFLAALLLLIPPVKNLAGMNTGFIMIRMAADSIFATLDEKEEEDNGKTELDYCSGQVVFDHVSLRYPSAERDAVHDFNLTVNPGDSVALVGFSGSGKTSLVNMIPRFWNPTSGRILIDGYDTRDITLKSLRKQIAIVSQDVILFDDTIRNNIAYGVPDATEAQINKAIDDAALREFIDALPKGLETPVGEAGNFLSGGQKQRISIARAILKDAPILILDEATSALDSFSETHIKNALAKLMKGRTVFIVAHRLSTVSGATTIVAMAEGEVKEIGTRDAATEERRSLRESLPPAISSCFGIRMINILKHRDENLVRLYKYFLPYKGKIAVASIFLIATALTSSATATLLGKLTDVSFYQGGSWLVFALPAALIAVTLVFAISTVLSAYIMSQVSQSVLVTLRKELFNSVLHWPESQYQKVSTGLISSKFVNESTLALSGAADSVTVMIRDTVQIIGLLCVLFWHDWILTLGHVCHWAGVVYSTSSAIQKSQSRCQTKSRDAG